VKSLTLTSYAKLNLYLEIFGKLPDKYHSIFTLFERISLADQINLKLQPDKKIRIIVSGVRSGLSRNRQNLAYQAASLLKREFGILQGVEIRIEKRMPIAAGLGGGSSNAAAVLKGLNRLWKLNLGVERLASVGRKVGSDIPFFLYNCSFACGSGRGDKIKVLNLPVRFWHVIVVPRIKVHSWLVYKKWDELTKVKGVEQKRLGLTTLQSKVKILKSALLKKDILLLDGLLFNSLEPVTSAMHPVIGKIKSALSNSGVEAISMSGSGPAVFGLVSSRKEAYAVARQLSKFVSWDVFVAKTA
jgi:4-diphosphocytidyl-2-C-methyl-D-erythritol kinase